MKPKFYAIDEPTIRYLKRLMIRLADVKSMNSDEMRDHMNKLYLIIDEAEHCEVEL